jgi:hypothetical protein
MSPRSALPALAALLLAGALAGRPAAAETAPVVVELFTSQGCSSCPPADRLLGEIKGRDGVIALSLHVDYWDYIGWEDPFGLARHTARQRAYKRRLELDYVYTPQIVVDGRYQAVGSRRAAVEAALAAAADDPARLSPRLETAGAGARLVIPAGDAPARPATVWLALYDGRHETRVRAGENAGTALVNHNVVRRWRKLGTWRGDRLEIPLDLAEARAAGRDGCAVLVQVEATGAILGAARMPLAR